MRQVTSMGVNHEAAVPRPVSGAWGASMSTELAALRSGLAPRRSAVGSLLALPVADVAAMLACFVAGGLLNFSFQNVTEKRTLILALLIAGSLVVFQHFGHYSRRRQFWQELGDIAMVARPNRTLCSLRVPSVGH